MTPGERIAVITESARLLETRDWPELDLILGQHELPISDNGYGNKFQYVIEMIQREPDAKLQLLHTYLTGGEQEPPAEAQPWAPWKLRLFASHLAAHQAFVGQVAESLTYSGVSAFVAHTSIEASAEWQDVIETGLRTCDAMVVFLHPGFHESNWCDQEVGFVLATRKPILIIRFDDLTPYGFMGKYQAIKGDGRSHFAVASTIADWLVASPTAQERMTDGLVQALDESPSYDQTRRLITLLERLPRFTPQQLEKIDQAGRSNNQVTNANLNGVMVPNIIRDLIARHGGIPAATAPADDVWGVPSPWPVEPPY